MKETEIRSPHSQEEICNKTTNSRIEETEKAKYLHDINKSFIPPKIWYEIRDPVDPKKLSRTQSHDLSQRFKNQNFKSNTWHRKTSKPLIKSNSFCFERNMSCDELYALADSTRSKINELFNYEPLSTPFAEIYAIECGKYSSKTLCTTDEENNHKTNIISDDYSTMTDNQTKHENDLEKLMKCSSVSDPESFASNIIPNTNKVEESKSYQSSSTIGSKGNDNNKANEEDENHTCSNLNTFSEIKSNSLLKHNHFLPNIYDISSFIRQINYFPSLKKELISDGSYEKLSRNNSLSFTNVPESSYKIQIFRLEDKHRNNQPIIRSCFRKSPFYCFFQSEENLKWAINTFVNDIRHSRELKHLIQVFINHLRRMSNTGTPIRQVESRSRNLSSGRSDQHIETEVVSAGEIVESGFASCVTSQTSRAAFVEYSFPPHSSCTRGSECFLSCTCSVPHLTVPAVQERLVVERESCSPSQWAAAVVALCSSTTDGESSTTNVCNRNSTWIQNNHNIILDYTIDTSAWRVDYNNEDYGRFGSLPSGLALLIVGGICNGAATGFRRIMATTDDDPRSLGRVVRTQGKNISKLMRLFDSNERTITYSSESVNFSSKSGDNRTKSCSIASQSVTEQQYSNEISNSKAIQNEASVVSEYTMKDSQSSAAFSKTNEVTVNNAVNSERSCNGENLSSEIPYCRKVSKNGLWENVNIGTKNDSKSLWNSVQNSNQADDLEQAPNSLLASTAELNDLIASSRAELSKKKEPSVSDKSNLENYFTSFENSKPVKCQLSSDMENSFASSDSNQYHNSEIFHPYLSSPYNCDINGMNFEDEEAMLSDTSSEEDMKCHPGMTNTNYLPAYALHTIIEESCEESERDSRTTTPTNDAVTSKLERYFSWDIINDTNRDLRKKSDDESTIYSDSLSESSNSLSNDEPKDIDPTHLASSRLEKYFTSGLVDDQNCYYPDDAEFLDDAPISDFEEDTVHQKISRSALLSSLETKKVISHQVNLYSEPQEFSNTESTNKFSNRQDNTESLIENDVNNDKFEYDCDRTSTPILSLTENTQTCTRISEKVVVSSENSEQTYPVDQIDSKLIIESEEIIISNNIESVSEIGAVAPSVQTSEKVSETENSFPEKENSMNKEENLSCSPKPTVNKDQLTSDIQAIIKKLVSYFTTETGSESFKKNIETNYVSAWHILETEIERLLQSISPNAIENNSCNSSTIDSNNSDYGSDTIESMDCITDDDDIDSKNRSDGKCPLVDILSSAYKFQSSNSELSSFNISDETLSIWKRLIQSLQKDNSVLSENKCDPNAEARLYIRDQIVTLMHTVTVNDNVHENEKLPSTYNSETKEISQSLIEVNDYPDQINEAFNVNVGSSNLLAHLTESDRLGSVIISKTESSDEGISDISTDAINVTSQITVFQDEFIQINEKASTDTVTTSIETDTSDKASAISCEPLCITDDLEKAPDNLENEKSDPSHQDKDKIIFSSKETLKKDNDLKFSVVEIALTDESKYVSEDNTIELDENITCAPPENFQTNDTNCEIDSSPLNRSHNHPDPSTSPLSVRIKDSLRSHKRLNPEASRDTGYYSFKSSDDSIINTTSSSAEFVDVPNFKSLKRTVKKFPVSNTTLSKSTNNILQSFSSSPDAKFSTLQLKSKKSKNSSNATNSPRQFTALFSPSAVLKRFTGSKSSETPNPESSIPQKYLKKYARSISTDNDSLFGAASMPQLNSPRGQGDSYSALGLYAENDKDSSLILDDDGDVKRYFSGSQSALSLGAHSASMTSVYSAAGCHYGFVTVSGDVLFGLNYNQKSQMMEVFIKECRNLAAIDVRHNKSNHKTRSGKRKTKTKKNTVNPVFNELLRFPVLKSELESRTLWLSVWNSDLFGRNDFLGEISLPLGYRLLDSPTLRWYPLQDRVESLPTPLQCKGELFIALKYVPRDLSLESRFRPAPVISLRGALHVLVKEARNISPLRSSMDAFCKSYLLPDKSKTAKQKTPVVRKSNHPKWYYTVIYEDLSIEELKERSLELTVWDHDKITRNNFVGGVRLNVGTGLYHGVPVDWMDSRRDESGLWLSMLDSPNMWVDGSLPLRPTMHTQGTGLFS
ncbi:synaptotagmin-like protein 5 [Caerostris extrusa]|uniref:Synaptotagmin-like protein 5 n=1 Tax=Caerostris extrusa TaxID=172846 RepID=A0AAV4V0F1_CAEEX|nr:synaptotagmin-like protein 5 [Caerostris extrusa]